MMILDETNRKLNHLADACERIAILTDTPGNSSASGMNLPVEAEILRCISENLREGIFNVLVMGKFKTGKSTFVNALVGKELMQTKVTACTAVITCIRYGQENNIVEVYHEDSIFPEKIL